MIRNHLKRYKYPPEQQASATELMLVQAETLAEEADGLEPSPALAQPQEG
jgi:hypothetical protein